LASSIRTLACYRNVLILAFGNLVAMFGFSMFTPIMSFYLFDYLGMSMFIVGIFFAMFAVVRALLQPLMGRISDKIGRKKMIVPALLSYSFVGYLYSTATNTLEFISYRTIQGVSSSTLWPASEALIADTVPTQERARASGAVSMTYQVGTMFGPSLGAAVAQLWGFKEVFYVCAILALVGAIMSALFLKEPRRINREERHAEKVATQIQQDKSDSPMKSIAGGQIPVRQKPDDTSKRRNRVVGILAVTSFLLVFTFSMNDMILSILIIDYYHTTLIDFAILYAVFVLIGGISAAVGGHLADKHGKRKILTVVTVSSVFAWLSLTLASTLILLAVIMSVYVFMATMNGPAISALVADLTPPERRGRIYGFLGLFNDLGLVAGPIVGGAAFDFLRLNMGFSEFSGMQGLFMINALASLIAAIVVARGVVEPEEVY
jgi:DHA1 family multidrug resistance protein-like MFS transporter